jgi:uncharacterized protein involved in exopolysaccharide biosynthesis
MSEDLTLRGLLRSLCEELAVVYRRELAAVAANVDRELAEREAQLKQLEEQIADDPEAEIAPEEYEAHQQLLREKEFATTVHDTLPDLTLEFKQVGGG